MKKTSKIKRLVSLGLFFLMSINSFATTVAENDGSAFITKSEFDALKSSFQSQIDYYNQSIDNKIDTAIATYLKGINIAKETERDNISYTLDGIYNVNKDELVYHKGDMYWFCRYYYVRENINPNRIGALMLEFYMKDAATDFTEMLINHPDYGNNAGAEWLGYCTTRQYLDTTKCEVTQNGFNMPANQPWFGFRANNPSISTVPDLIGKTLWYGGWNYYVNEPTGHTTYYNSMAYAPDYATFQREISAKSHQHVILTPQSLYEPRFSNNDGLHDFMNDSGSDYSSYHTTLNSSSMVMKIHNSDLHTFAERWGTDAMDYTFRKSDFKIHPYLLYPNGGAVPNNITRPYAGFDKNITNYNKLWTRDYDSYLEDIRTKCGNINQSLIQNHLALYAGTPIFEIKKDESVLLPIEFEDDTKDYDVWIKLSPFKNFNP